MLGGDAWRYLVRNQSAAMICRGTIISNLVSSEWRIIPRIPEDAGKYKDEIQYYTDLIIAEDGGWDVHVELVMQDALDLPFGGVTEVGHENDSPDGRVLWYQHMDAATCVPTYNADWPIAQVGVLTTYSGIPPIFFPKHAVSRVGYTPRPELQRKGWFMAPPEKIYLALELLSRGDKYYANLLLDTPQVGLLDLGDTTEETATDWVQSWRDLLAGTEVFKIPVLFEHTTPVNFIAFGRSPVELAYDRTTLRYMQIAAAGYDLSLSDIGIVEGETGASLAGSIRQERRSLRTGIGIARRKIAAYFDRILPNHLRFEIVIKDEETLMARGRARLALSLGLINLVSSAIIDRETALEQLISDGVLTVPATVPDILEGAMLEPAITTAKQSPGVPNQVAGAGGHQVIGKILAPPKPASKGGEGEVSARSSYGDSKWYVEQYSLIAVQLQQIVAEAASEKGVTLEVPSFKLTNEDALTFLSVLADSAVLTNPPVDVIQLSMAEDILKRMVPTAGEVPVKMWAGD